MKLRQAGIALTLSLAFSSFTTAAAHAADDDNAVINDALAVVGEAPLTTAQADSQVTTAGVTIEGADTAMARKTSTGGQVIDVLTDGETSTTFEVDVPAGYEIEQVGDTIGVVSHVLEGTGEDATESLIVHGTFDAPWAVDADGQELPTAYEVIGDKLVQTVETDGASYPIVADPSYTYRDIKFSWSIWTPFDILAQANQRGSRVTSNGPTTALCVGVALVPVFGTGLAVACGVSVAVDNIAYEYGRCVQFKFNGITRYISKSYYRGGFCK